MSTSAQATLHWLFCRGLLFAVPAGFVTAWPVNYWLIKRELKACHRVRPGEVRDPVVRRWR